MLLFCALVGAVAAGLAGLSGVPDWNIYACLCLFVAALAHAKSRFEASDPGSDDELWPY